MLNALALLVVFCIATGPFIVARGKPGVASVIPGFNIVIINGRIIDGSGNPRFYGRNMLRASEEAPRRLLDSATPEWSDANQRHYRTAGSNLRTGFQSHF